MAKTTQRVILVVDDEPAMRGLARRMLEGDGYAVVEATNGVEGLRVMAERETIDLIVADLEMPELGGDEMARQIRMKHPDLKVLYVTGRIDKLLDERPILWDGEAFLDKPYSRAGLLEAVSLLLDGTIRRADGR